MKDHMLILVLTFLLWTWMNLYLRRTKRQKIIQKETKALALKRFKRSIKSDEKQIRKTMILRMAGGNSGIFVDHGMDAYRWLPEKSSRSEDETEKPEGKHQKFRLPLVQHTVNVDFLRLKARKAEFKITALKNLKLLVFGIVFLWSCLTFFELFRDFLLEDNSNQFRWIMFNLKIKLFGGILI